MKKLNINNAGRMPLWQKDLEFIQKGYTEPFEALVGELGLPTDYFIIAGCSPYMTDSGHIAMNKGWFYYGGRVLPVRQLLPTSVASFSNPVVRLVPVTYADPDGARGFIHADQTSETVIDVWRDDYLQPSVVERAAEFTSGVRLCMGAWTLADIIANRNADAESAWTQSLSGKIEFKRVGRLVVLKGSVTKNNSGPADEGFPSPLGGLAVLVSATKPGELAVSIDAAGAINCKTTGNQLGANISGMTYMAATPYTLPDTDPNTINDNHDADADENNPQQ